jgi:diacylglycerol kinase (ATP)
VRGGKEVVKRARIIYNPSSGREELVRKLPYILQKFEKAGIETSCSATEKEGDATYAAGEAIRRGFDIIIAAGGDGTVSEVINGMAEHDVRPPLGMLPFGTTNDLARALGIPRQWEQAADLIIGQKTRAIDIGKMNDRYFINIAGGGSLTELTYEVASKMKTVLGQLAYYIKGLEKLPRLKPLRLQMKGPGIDLQEEAMLFLIANSNSVAGFERLAPGATIDDGLLDVIVIRKMSLPEFIRLVGLVIRGEHMNDPGVIHFQTNELDISSSDPVLVNMDGEMGGSLPSHCRVLPHHLQIFVDPAGLATYSPPAFGFKAQR